MHGCALRAEPVLHQRRLNQCWLKYDNPSVGGAFPRFRNDPSQAVGWLSGVVDTRVAGDKAPAEGSHDCRCQSQWQYRDPETGRNSTFKVGRQAGHGAAAIWPGCC